jgi:hypothetical protein
MALADLQPAEGQKQELTLAQEKQLNRDLLRLLPEGYPDKVPAGIASAARVSPEVNDPTAPTKVTRGGAWRLRQFPMGGWVYHDVSYRWQRQDQGQDFEITTGHHVIAPGWGHCVSHLSDSPWPDGFGSPYAVVYIGSGRFAGRLWYLGHDNYVQIRVGESFHTGRILTQPKHEMNHGWVWTELGHAPNGYPGSMAEGPRWHYLFAPIWRWSS